MGVVVESHCGVCDAVEDADGKWRLLRTTLEARALHRAVNVDYLVCSHLDVHVLVLLLALQVLVEIFTAHVESRRLRKICGEAGLE